MAHTDTTAARTARAHHATRPAPGIAEHRRRCWPTNRTSRAMRRYRSFAFDDHTATSGRSEGLLRTLASAGRATPPSPSSTRTSTRNSARDRASTPTPPPAAPATRRKWPPPAPPSPTRASRSTELLPRLVDEAVRSRPPGSTPATLLARARRLRVPAARTSAAPPSTAPRTSLHAHARRGRARATTTSSAASRRRRDPLVAVLHADATARAASRARRAPRPSNSRTVLALGIATESPGGLVLRTTAPGTTGPVRGWRAARRRPATADAQAEVFDAYCTDARHRRARSRRSTASTTGRASR